MKYLILLISFYCFIAPSDASPAHQEKDTTVYLFLLHDCVICQSYAPSLEKIHQEYKDRFDFVAVFPNFISKKPDIETFMKENGLNMTTKTDYFKGLTKKLGLEVTPTAVVFDEVNEEILYFGRIDDEFASLGVRRSVVKEFDLLNALRGLSSKSDYVKSTSPVGCFINFGELKY
ncbi:MAG: redoxin family protein [Saprospiraceae bacterium]|nr:redoxin family protein [Saprospiraceae bacterium]